MPSMNASRTHGAGWSPELLTVLGAVLAVGVALGALIFTGLAQVRADMHTMEERLRDDMQGMEGRLRDDMQGMEGQLREDMRAMEKRIREDMQIMEARIRDDMQTMEGRLRQDTRELRGDVAQLRERASNLEGRLAEGSPSPTSL